MNTWSTIFEEAHPETGASEDEIREFVSRVLAPLSDEEIAEINSSQQNPFPKEDPLHASWNPFNPAQWQLPNTPIPEIYLDFTRWSNGGEFRNGNRHFGFFGTDIRDFLVAYHIPEYMPLAVPFAFDGGGTFYLFDMREPPREGEYPIVFAHAGNLGWDEDDHTRIADSFLGACRGDADPHELRIW